MRYRQKEGTDIDPDAIGCGMFVLVTITVVIFYSIQWLWEHFLETTCRQKNNNTPS